MDAWEKTILVKTRGGNEVKGPWPLKEGRTVE